LAVFFKVQDTDLLPGLGAKKWVVNEISRTVTEVPPKKWVVFRFARTVSHLLKCIYKIGAQLWIQTWSLNVRLD
jgi:hypothetical protein